MDWNYLYVLINTFVILTITITAMLLTNFPKYSYNLLTFRYG